MALRNQLPLECIRVFGLAASSLLAHIKSPVIARANRQPRATTDSSNHPKIEGVPLMLTLEAKKARYIANMPSTRSSWPRNNTKKLIAAAQSARRKRRRLISRKLAVFSISYATSFLGSLASTVAK